MINALPNRVGRCVSTEIKLTILIGLVVALAGCASPQKPSFALSLPVLAAPAIPEPASGLSNVSISEEVVDDDTKPPRISPGAIILRAPPRYPAQMLVHRTTGEVWVIFVINTQGYVTSSRIVSATNELFGSAVLAAMKDWRYQPVKIYDRPVNVRVKVRVTFNIESTANPGSAR